MDDQPNTECLNCGGYVPAGTEFCCEGCRDNFQTEAEFIRWALMEIGSRLKMTPVKKNKLA
jgi:predicted nucleic acid-binding Zn ribbon protein